MKNWKYILDHFYDEADRIPHLKVMDDKASLDRTKINLNFGEFGINGAQLEKLLMEHGIFSELYTGDLLMLMTGIGNTKAHMEKTLTALKYIADKHKGTTESVSYKKSNIKVPEAGKLHPVPKYKKFVEITDASGCICAGSIIPYPPGIPFVCPGEEITPEIIDYIVSLREAGEKVIGVNDNNQVLVGSN